MRYLKTSLLLVLLAVFSCCGNKTTKEAMADTKDASMNTKMMENGFKMGTIVASKAEGECPFMIQMESEGEEKPVFLDPINLDESYKTNGQKIWFTFNGLRMMNRCIKANPVSIVEMQKRAE